MSRSIQHNNLFSQEERKERRQKQREQVLNFLRDEIWSSTCVLATLFCIKSLSSAKKALLQFEKESLIRHSIIHESGYPKTTLWGITPHGQTTAMDLDKPTIQRTSFEPSKIKAIHLAHHLGLQQLRLKAENMGYSQWLPGTCLGKLTRNEKRPDAVAITPEGHQVAIEYERTAKSIKRYEEIMSAYLQLVKQGQYHHVLYVFHPLTYKDKVFLLI